MTEWKWHDQPQLLKRVNANKTKFIHSLKLTETGEALANDIWLMI
jgi:hypothetical protein